VIVVGAGAFGGWTAWWLAHRGVRVTLVDAWGPGNARASSGGETRVIRGMYGPDRLFTDWTARSFDLWREAEERFSTPFYHPTGCLWMFRGDDVYARRSLPAMEAAGLAVESLAVGEAAVRFPGVDFTGVAHVHYEPRAGYLAARDACRAIARGVAVEGGEVLAGAVRPGPVRDGRMDEVVLADGRRLAGDLFVFACGPWLPALFPEALGPVLSPTRQDVFYFGPPLGEHRFDDDRFPVWIDFGRPGERIFYGLPGNRHRGFKVADDTHGESVEPTGLERRPLEENLERARGLLAERFPSLADAPLVETRTCQYTNTPDGQYLADRHPAADNVWFLGGGSGHGFKLSPALGEVAAGWVLGEGSPPERFSLARHAAASGHPEGGVSQFLTGGTP
jgi:glycine/D-amino acid oxidase-like deaminating enzyme